MTKTIKIITLVIFSSVSFNLNPFVNDSIAAQTTANLIKNGSFETTIDTDWDLWYEGIDVGTATKKFEMYRSYEPAIGNGLYSVAVESFSDSGSMFSASISSNAKNSFSVEAGKEYYLIYHIKAKQAAETAVYLVESGVYQPLSNIKNETVSNQWQRRLVVLKPSKSANAQLVFSCGSLATGNLINIDGVQIGEVKNAVLTSDVKGKIGDSDKYIKIDNISAFNENDIQIELPYYDALSGKVSQKVFAPTKISGSNVYFDFAKGSFSGIAKVLIGDSVIGTFNYSVDLKINEVNPALIRADDDLVIYGSGFNPNPKNTFIIIKQKDKDGKISDQWIEPNNIDSALTQISAKLPLGVVNGDLSVYSSFINNKGVELKIFSGKLAYKVKPIIYDAQWSQRGYEQVGDKITIYGKGVIDNPTINFYNENDVKVDSVKAVVKEIADKEVLEVEVSKKINKFLITVVSGGVESDKTEALDYSARPKLISISSKNSRAILGSSEKVSAAKIGEIIKIKSEGLLNIGTAPVYAEFNTYNNNHINVDIASQQIDKSGYVFVTVPEGTQNGYVAIIANNEKSNSLPLEIIPDIISISPETITAGQEMIVVGNGIGLNSNLTKIYFNIGNSQQVAAKVVENKMVNNQTVIKAIAPMTLPNKVPSIKVQYDNWMDDSSLALKISPQINRARMDMDTKILTIEGYGFSIIPGENKITYKYADEAKTVINPNAKILGVYATDEGQEIRIQINSGYYYGYLALEVGGLSSNEINFGPIAIKKIVRRVEYVKSVDKVMGVLYISGNNFGAGDVKVGDVWAETHYRSNFLIIAVVNEADIDKNPVTITKK